MKISKETLRGYLLEEALAYLIRGTGYTLLVDRSQDPLELENRGHGLVVKGRGSEHQADVLGELNWIPAFTFPIRLFVEAKYRNARTGIAPVRNAVGILEDINQNYFSIQSRSILTKRYTYNYALFSTSGFSQDAVNMAIAHRISLIDLSGSDFEELKTAIDTSAESIINLLDEQNGNLNTTRNDLLKRIRKNIRLHLGTWHIDNDNYSQENEYGIFNNFFKNYYDVIYKYGELFVGMAKGPFLLILKAENPERFLSYAQENPSHFVSISWSDNDNNGRLWRIQPQQIQNNAYKLSFSLPKLLGDIIFESEDPIRSALNVKREYFSNITIYRSNFDKDELFRLQWRTTSRRNYDRVL